MKSKNSFFFIFIFIAFLISACGDKENQNTDGSSKSDSTKTLYPQGAVPDGNTYYRLLDEYKQNYGHELGREFGFMTYDGKNWVITPVKNMPKDLPIHGGYSAPRGTKKVIEKPSSESENTHGIVTYPQTIPVK